jgi:amino acid permease
MASEELFTRDEVLGGMPAQRAHTLLFLIESRTAQLAAKSRRAMLWDQSPRTAEQQDLDFLEAFTAGKDPPLRPTIQDLERFAPQWAALIPENPNLRAALAKLLGEKYKLVRQAIPNLRRILALDDPATQRAYQRQQREPLESIYAPRPSQAERLQWLQSDIASRLESLPPFWTAFSLTLTQTVGVGILALPIAVAGIGPLPAIGLILLIGLLNLVTVACMAEAVARSGEIRYGNAYFGRLVTDLLGKDGSLVLRLSLVMIYALALLASLIGLSTTLADAIGLPAIAWVLLIFLVDLYFLRKGSINATVWAALLIGFVNIGLILAICLLALPAIQQDFLTAIHLPLLQGEPFDPAILGLVFGAILLAYFGHTSMGSCARVVLQRDPSARSLIWGSISAMIAAMALYSIWVLAVNGAVAPEALAAETGTALGPLTDQLGATIGVLGSLFAILAMGMGSIHYTLGFNNLMREWLPRAHQPEILLTRRQGRLIFSTGGKDPNLRIGIGYLGTDRSQALLNIDVQSGGSIHRFDTRLGGRLDCWQLFSLLPGWDQVGHRLILESLGADADSARLRIDSNLAFSYEEQWRVAGLDISGLLELPDEDRRLIELIMRQGESSLEELARQTSFAELFLKRKLESLALQGYLHRVETVQGRRYQVQLASKRASQLPEPLWQAFESQPFKEAKPAGWSTKSALVRFRDALQSRTIHSILGASPIVAIFLVTVWLLATGQESFTRPISFLGLIVVSFLGGAFPVMLLIASRRKGELVPQVVYRSLGNRLLLGFIFLVSVGVLFLHGLLIWQNPVERLSALSAGILMLVITLIMFRRGVFHPRAVVELLGKTDLPEQADLSVNIAAQPAPAEVVLGFPDGELHQRSGTSRINNLPGLKFIDINLPSLPYKDLKVWAHEVTPDGSSFSLPVKLEIRQGETDQRYDLTLSSGQHLFIGEPRGGQTIRNLRLVLESEDSPG